MFRKHDKILFIAQIIFWMDTAIIAVASIVWGIWGAVVASPLYVLVIFGGLWGSFIHWVFTTLFISFLKDVKIIRNKLYGESIESLEIGVVQQKGKVVEQKVDAVEQKEKIAELTEKQVGDPYEED